MNRTSEFTLYRCRELGAYGKFQSENPCKECQFYHCGAYTTEHKDNVDVLKVSVQRGKVVSAELLSPVELEF